MATDATSAADFVTPADDRATTATRELAPEDRPYKPSWVNLLIDWLERLPGPTLLAYLAVVAVGAALALLQLVGMRKPAITDVAAQMFWAFTLPAVVWLTSFLARTAGSALDSFRPALTVSDEEASRLRYELTVAPARPALVLLVLSAFITPLYYLGDPAGSDVVGLAPGAMLGRYLAETSFAGLMFVLLYQSWRQLRAVERVHAHATRVDLFRPAPLYSFSVLTSRAAIVIALLFIVPTMVGVLSVEDPSPLLFVPWVAAGAIVAAAVFVLPLRGMQKRIIAEKRRLQSEVGLRLERTIAAIHRSVDAGEITQASGMNDALAALIAERELVDKLPTLPWRPGTLGGLVTAMVLPVGLFLVQRVLSQLLG